MYFNLAMRMYCHEITDTVRNVGYMLNPVPSPYLGQIGMLNEINTYDGSGVRSSLMYAWDGVHMNIQGAATMLALGEWGIGVSAVDTEDIESRMYYGIEDFKHKAQQGWSGRKNGDLVEEYTSDLGYAGIEYYQYIMALWDDFIKPEIQPGQ
jgi:hypothetical protein